jgi:hypothetical protein
MSRWTLFFIVLLLGLGLGLLYGWVINPVSYQDTTLDTLRIDYKTDYPKLNILFRTCSYCAICTMP